VSHPSSQQSRRRQCEPIDLVEAVRRTPAPMPRTSWPVYRRAIRAAALMLATDEHVEQAAACRQGLGLSLDDLTEHIRVMRRAHLLRLRLDEMECFTRRAALQRQLAELFALHPQLFPNGLED